MSVVEERGSGGSDRRLKIVSLILHVIAIVGGLWFGITSFYWIAGG